MVKPLFIPHYVGLFTESISWQGSTAESFPQWGWRRSHSFSHPHRGRHLHWVPGMSCYRPKTHQDDKQSHDSHSLCVKGEKRETERDRERQRETEWTHLFNSSHPVRLHASESLPLYPLTAALSSTVEGRSVNTTLVGESADSKEWAQLFIRWDKGLNTGSSACQREDKGL